MRASNGFPRLEYATMGSEGFMFAAMSFRLWMAISISPDINARSISYVNIDFIPAGSEVNADMFLSPDVAIFTGIIFASG